MRISDLRVMESAAGYYVGRSYYDSDCHADLPYSRDSIYMTEDDATRYLRLMDPKEEQELPC